MTRPRKKILVVDDDRSMIRLLHHILEKEHEVLVAETSSQAITLLNKLAIDGLITDISLDEGDGYEIIRHVRESQNDYQLPIIVLSSKDTSEDRITGLKLGADDFLTKPFNPEELKLRLQNLFRRMDTGILST